MKTFCHLINFASFYIEQLFYTLIVQNITVQVLDLILPKLYFKVTGRTYKYFAGETYNFCSATIERTTH